MRNAHVRRRRHRARSDPFVLSWSEAATVAKKTTIPQRNMSRSEAWQEIQTTITFWNVSRSEGWQRKKTTVAERNVLRCEVWQTKKTTITEFGYLILVCNGVKVIGILKFQDSGENQYGSSNSWIFSSIFMILIIC